MRNVSDKGCREDQNTHFIFNIYFFENIAFYQNNVEKYCRVGQATDDNIIRRMRIFVFGVVPMGNVSWILF